MSTKKLQIIGGALFQPDWEETDPTSAAFVKNKPNLDPVALSGDYNQLKNLPIVDSKITKGSKNLITSGTVHEALLLKVDSDDLSKVATSGNYSDLNNKPVLTDLSGTLPIKNGGTGATTAAEARTNLGITTQLDKKVDLAGDTMTGNLAIQNSNPYLILKNNTTGREVQIGATSDGFATYYHALSSDTANNRTGLWVGSEDSANDDLLRIQKKVNGTSTTYKVLHTGTTGGDKVQYLNDVTSNVQTQLNSKAPSYTYSTKDLTEGTSALTTGKLYFVYEA